MSEEERQAFLKVSFEDMESYCRSRGLLQLTRVLSAAAEKKFLGSRDKSCFLWICPVCPIIIPLHEGFYHDKTQFMIHMETFHIKIEDEEYEKMRSIMPETIPDHEMELLKSWRWEPQPIDGDDLAERAKILSDVKRIVSKLIDREAISLNLLYAIYTFIMTWVRPARPYVVSMCGCCGIGQLSSERLKELYKLLEPLTYILTGYEHQTRHNGEQESQQDSLVATFLVNETGTYMCFDCGKIASTKADGSNQLIDEMFDSLFCESLLMYPSESWDDMTQRCFGFGPDIVKKMREALDKLKTNCSSCEILKGKFPDFFLPDAILETVFDAKSYFHSGIDCAQVEMLLIDAEVDYLRKRLLETCRMNIVLTVLPVAKACLWDKWNNSPPQKALRLCPLNDLELEAPLDMILRSLWHLRRFHDTLQKIPCKFPHVKDGESQIGMELREIFDSWDDDEECKPCDPCGSTRFADFSNSLVYKKDGNRRTATEIVKIIFRRLHSSQTPLHFEFKCESLEQQTVVEPSLHSCICLMHDLFGLHICENKCNCMNEVPRKYKHTTFFHNIDLGAVGNAKFESLSELLKVMESRIESCGHKVPQYSLLYPPRLFMTVFQWKNDKVCHINMHEVLLNLTTELDISHFYGGLPPGSNYTLVSAVCCNDRGQYICFARNNNRWLTYGNNAVMSAESWQESTDRYRQDNLRPEVVFFEHAIRSSR
ncbi:uncharacterized protein LOC102714870 [Oryza brachyantha]|uniref:uncharacterized protein LOC102714870 n=1 Tax=Oryza brachyantha TaxID=4533 RepID=UPI000776A968|nr:uncharacterized protein LOC102714870 [Oryza brachyantha]